MLQERVKSITRTWWLVLCAIYFIVTVSIATVLLIKVNGSVDEGLVPNDSEQVGKFIDLYYIYPVNTTDGLVAFKQTGLDTSFWGHLYQSNLNKDIARALGVQPDRFWTDGTIRNNALRFVVLDDKYSVLSIRDKVDTNFTTGDEMLEELHVQLQDAESAFRQLEFGNAVYEAQLGPLKIGDFYDVSSDMNITGDNYLDHSVDLYQDFSLRFLNEGERLPGEKEYSFSQSDLLAIIIAVVIPPVWFVLGLFFTIPLLVPLRCSKTEISKLEYGQRVKNLFLSVVAVLIILGIATAVVGLQDKANWFSDPYLLPIVERVSSWLFVGIGVLAHLGFTYALGSFFVCCCDCIDNNDKTNGGSLIDDAEMK